MPTTVRWSCAALLDLLGFSNHLMLTNFDIRTQTGSQAIDRLNSLENAIKFFEKEEKAYPQLYPTGLKYVRFNDALFLGIEVEHLTPPPGQTHLIGGFSVEQIRKIGRQDEQTDPAGKVVDAGNVAKFLGLVARIHNYINVCEAEKSFPGCRTVVASGLRKCFKTRKGIDDFFSANFSVAIAFEAEKKGSSAGIKGPHLYVEDDIATAISYCDPAYSILGFSKFINTKPLLTTPYQYQHNAITPPRSTWSVSAPIDIDIMNKRHTFRRLNTSVLSNLQLFHKYQDIERPEKDELAKQILKSFNSSTPSLENVNKKIKISDYPFLSLRFKLDMDLPHFFGK